MSTAVSKRPIRVGVLVGLAQKSNTSGHVKCWEQLAEAAARVPEEVDLTVYLLGNEETVQPIGENVRYYFVPPSFSTDHLPLSHVQTDHTDLALQNPYLAEHLADHDVLHTTDAWFAFGRTAMRHHCRYGTPLTTSTHTDVPACARVFVREMIESLTGGGKAGEWVVDHLPIDRQIEHVLRRRLERYFSHCDHVLASSDDDFERASSLLPPGHVSRLHRGIKKDLFHPRYRNRDRLQTLHRIPADRFVVLFVGRFDPAKNPMLVAQSVGLLARQGVPVHAAFVGDGPLRDRLAETLGDAGTVLAPLPHEQLREVYASADLFAFPSQAEVTPNVVIEAKASGLPVLVPQQGPVRWMIERDHQDGVQVASAEPAAWAAAIEELRRDDECRERIGRKSRLQIERRWPSWETVLRKDLLPVWQRVRRTKAAARWEAPS